MMRLARGRKFLALFISGTLLPLSLAPFNLWPIAIVSMAVLFRTLQHQTLRQAFSKSLVFGFGMFFAGVSWVYVSIHEHGFIPAPLALLATTLFCLFIALLFALPFTLSALIPQRPASWLVGLPAIWVISEWFRSWAFTGFPWLYSGYIHTETWLGGWAPLGGVFWLSFSQPWPLSLEPVEPAPQKSSQHSYRLPGHYSLASQWLLTQQINWTSLTGKIFRLPWYSPTQTSTKSGPTVNVRESCSSFGKKQNPTGALILLSGPRLQYLQYPSG